MPTEFDDSAHWGFFTTGTTLTSATGKYVRMSELALAALRAAGLFDNMVDGTVAPATNKFWLDKNFDPAQLKEWDPIGSSWERITFARMFERASVTMLTVTGGTANAIVVSEPAPFISNRLYMIIPTASNSGAATIQVTGVGTYGVKYPDGSDIVASELFEGKASTMVFRNNRFELIYGYAAAGIAVAAAAEAVAAAASINLPDMTIANAKQVLVAKDDGTGYDLKDAGLPEFKTWTSARYQTLKDRSKHECHILDFCAPHNSNVQTTEILNWLAEGQTGRVSLKMEGNGNGHQDFIIDQEMEITQAGTIIEFDGGGYAAGGGPDWTPGNVRLKAVGAVGGWFNTTGKRIRTRRLYRASAADPQDATLSALINIQAENVTLIRPTIQLYCDYTNTAQSNFGDYCDVGIFNGSRTNMILIEPKVLGYFRSASIYLDATDSASLQRHRNKAGVAYPTGSQSSGIDNWTIIRPFLQGGRQTLALRGARPKAGSEDYTTPYYDQYLGGTVADNRGIVGASDGYIEGGRILGPEHHSNYRLQDPTLSGGVLNSTSLHAEPDNMPAAVYIDGLAGNSSTSVWGIRFNSVRIGSAEAFIMRLRHAARVALYSCHFEQGGGSALRAASGAAIATGIGGTGVDDYVHNSYGDIAGETITNRVNVFEGNRSVPNDVRVHFYGTDFSHWLTRGEVRLARTLTLDSDLQMTGNVLGPAGGSLELRGASGQGVRLRSDLSTIADITDAGIYGNTTASAASVFVTSANVLQRSTSSVKYKTDVEDLADEYRDTIMSMRPVWYRSLCAGDNPDWSFYGLIAEEVAEIDPRLVHWRTHRFETTYSTVIEDGQEVEKAAEILVPLETPEAEGVMYERIVPHLIAKVQELSQRIQTLEAGEDTP